MADLDPPAELLAPVTLPHPQLRVYALEGRHTLLLWCRGSHNTWQSELQHHQPPAVLSALNLDLTDLLDSREVATASTCDPWVDRREAAEAEDEVLSLRSFSRSLVVLLTLR